MAVEITEPWAGRREPFIVNGKSGDFLGLQTPYGIGGYPNNLWIVQTNAYVDVNTPVYGRARDGTNQGSSRMTAVWAIEYDNPNLRLAFGVTWVGSFDLYQEPQIGVSYVIRYTQVAPNGTESILLTGFNVGAESHPAQSVSATPPFTRYYTTLTLPWVTLDGAYQYKDFKIVSITLPQFYNP